MDNNIKPINPKIQYRPMEIFKNGWIVNTLNKPDYKYVLKLVRMGKLKARNAGLGETDYFLITGQELINYRKEVYGLETPTTSENNSVSEPHQPSNQI